MVNFLADFLMKGKSQQAQPINQFDIESAVQKLEQPPLTIEGYTPLAEIDAREGLANSLLETANDRSAHPLARGLSAYMGQKQLLDISSERAKTEQGLAEIEQRRKEQEVEQQRAFELEKQDRGFEGQRGLQSERLKAQQDLQKQKQEFTAGQNALQRRMQTAFEARKIALQEQKEQGKIDNKQEKAQLAKIERDEKVVSGIDNGTQTIQQIDDLINHPGFEAAVGAGFQKTFTGGDIDEVGGGFIAGTDAASFSERLKQLKGGAFLQARQLLKGGGAISDTESNKAESAQTRMSLAQSEKEFIKAANEYKEVISKGVERAKNKAKTLGIEAPPESTTSEIKFLGFE
jgi:hypothetical protein